MRHASERARHRGIVGVARHTDLHDISKVRGSHRQGSEGARWDRTLYCSATGTTRWMKYAMRSHMVSALTVPAIVGGRFCFRASW